jgi:hypothetical protein
VSLTAAERRWDLDARVQALDDPAFHTGVTREKFAHLGRLQLIALLRRGLTPDSPVIDVGCGALRAGYWLIHFLDPGMYYGIEPRQASLDVARKELLEPGLEELKRPRFDDNMDFDLSVFGIAPRFVLARSIWSHTSKPQIEAMLDSFAAVAADDALLLASYLPASPTGAQARLSRMLAGLRPSTRGATGTGAGRRARRDYRGTGWAGRGPLGADKTKSVIAHSFDWIAEQCARRELTVRESDQDNFRNQTWLEVRRSPRS